MNNMKYASIPYVEKPVSRILIGTPDGISVSANYRQGTAKG